jgi:hypothetical protein
MTYIVALVFSLHFQGFDPDGYYFPQPELRVGRFEIQSFGLDVVYSPSHTNRPPTASLQIVKTGQETPKVHFTNSVIANADTLSLKFVTKEIGTVRVTGSFVDKRGSFAHRDDLDPDKTIVLTARVVVENQGREIYSKVHQFTYYSGD